MSRRLSILFALCAALFTVVGCGPLEQRRKAVDSCVNRLSLNQGVGIDTLVWPNMAKELILEGKAFIATDPTSPEDLSRGSYLTYQLTYLRRRAEGDLSLRIAAKISLSELDSLCHSVAIATASGLYADLKLSYIYRTRLEPLRYSLRLDQPTQIRLSDPIEVGGQIKELLLTAGGPSLYSSLMGETSLNALVKANVREEVAAYLELRSRGPNAASVLVVADLVERANMRYGWTPRELGLSNKQFAQLNE